MAEAPSEFDARVVVLTHYLPPYIVGVMQHLSNSVRNMRILLSIPEEPNRQYGNTWDGLQVDVQKSWMIRRPWKHDSGFRDELYVHFPYDTWSQLRRSKPDIIFSFELGFRSLACAFYRRTHRHCRLALCVCVSEHTEQGRGPARWLLRRTLLKLADAVTYNGPSCRRYLESFGVPAEKLFHVPYAAHDRYRTVTGVERSEKVDKKLIYVGQLTERKGVIPLVKALADYCRQCPQRIVQLSIVGTGPSETSLRTIEKPKNFEISFLGHIAPTEIPELLRQHGALVFPTLADEWGLVVNEAMHTGLPVIGSVFAQASTALIREGENGWLFSPAEPQELAAKCDVFFALGNPDLLQKRYRARESVEHITSAWVADQILYMFREMNKLIK